MNSVNVAIRSGRGSETHLYSEFFLPLFFPYFSFYWNKTLLVLIHPSFFHKGCSILNSYFLPWCSSQSQKIMASIVAHYCSRGNTLWQPNTFKSSSSSPQIGSNQTVFLYFNSNHLSITVSFKAGILIFKYVSNNGVAFAYMIDVQTIIN